MLHLPDGSTTITLAYDVVLQTHLDSDGKMALAINRKYGHAAITVDELIAGAEAWKVRAFRSISTSALEAVDSFVHSESPVDQYYADCKTTSRGSPISFSMDAPRAAAPAPEDVTHARTFTPSTKPHCCSICGRWRANSAEHSNGEISLGRAADVLRDGDRASVERMLTLMTVPQAVGILEKPSKSTKRITERTAIE